MLVMTTERQTQARAAAQGAGEDPYAGTQFTCFTGTKVQILIYWYKSTNTDAAVELVALFHASLGAGNLLPCFTSTKVQILTLRGRRLRGRLLAASSSSDVC